MLARAVASSIVLAAKARYGEAGCGVRPWQEKEAEGICFMEAVRAALDKAKSIAHLRADTARHRALPWCFGFRFRKLNDKIRNRNPPPHNEE